MTPAYKQGIAANLERAEQSIQYNFDYRQARPNRFAGRVDKSQVVMLDLDIFDVAPPYSRIWSDLKSRK